MYSPTLTYMVSSLTSYARMLGRFSWVFLWSLNLKFPYFHVLMIAGAETGAVLGNMWQTVPITLNNILFQIKSPIFP